MKGVLSVDVSRHCVTYSGPVGQHRRTDLGQAVDGIDRVGPGVWSSLLDDACGWFGQVGELVVTLPSGWGARRASSVCRAADVLSIPTTVLPRAVAVARSHVGGSAQRCCVIELASVDGDGVGPDADAVHRLVRTAVGWVIDVTVLCDSLGEIRAALDPSSEAVFVDGPGAAHVAESIGGGFGPISGVDPRLFVADGEPPPADIVFDLPECEVRARRVGRSMVAAAALAVVVLLAAAVWWGSADRPAHADGPVMADLGRIQVEVPAGWRRTDDGAARTTFTHPSDGRRIAVVQNALRDNVGIAVVAASLQQRIMSRGDNAVREFAGESSYAGRTVITYREAPVSGGPIHWYVVVERALQVSIGCQTGDAGESIEAQCHAAVARLMVR